MIKMTEDIAVRSKWGQWQTVEEQLNRDITSGALAAGARLPTETEMMERFGVGRHTVRRAIAELAAAGKVRVEQGRGSFVEEPPEPKPLERSGIREDWQAASRFPAR